MATITVNAYIDAEILQYNEIIFPYTFIDIGKYVNTNYANFAIIQFSIPNLSDISISSAKLRFKLKKTRSTNPICAVLYDFGNKVINSNTVYSDIAQYMGTAVLVSGGKYTPTIISDEFDSVVEVDITNLVIGNIGKNNFTVALALEDGSSGSKTHTMYSINTDNGYGGPFTEQIVINYTDAVPFPASLVYPVGDIVENSGTVRFSWKYNAGESSTGQLKYEFGWKMQSETSWNTVTVSSSNQYHDMDASAFANGVVEWRVRTYNAKGLSSEYATAQFFVVGKPPNPGINYVKNDAITEIQWSANKTEEVAAQLRLVKGNEILYDSGRISGGLDDRHIPDIILPDGQYAALLRISNLYDMWSDWTSRAFSIGGTKPSKPEIRISGQGDYVHIEVNGDASEYFIYRSDGKGYIPIARIDGSEYDDYSVESGKLYHYFVRAYTQSYTDGDIVDIFVRYKGRIISSVGDMSSRVCIRVNIDDDVGISRGISRSDALVRYVGREYPVKEKSEFKDKNISVNAFLSNDDAKKLIDIIDSGDTVCIRGSDMKLYGSIDSISTKYNVLFGGYEISFSMECVDYSEVIRFDV